MLTTLVLFTLLNCQTSDSLLIPFPLIPGNYINEDKHYVEIRKYNLIKKIDTLIYNGKVIIKPDSTCFFYIYEIFNEKYVIVTPLIKKDTWYRSDVYQLPKYGIKIIFLENVDEIYEVNLEGQQLIDIDLGKGKVCVKNPKTGKNKELKLKRIK